MTDVIPSKIIMIRSIMPFQSRHAGTRSVACVRGSLVVLNYIMGSLVGEKSAYDGDALMDNHRLSKEELCSNRTARSV